MKKIIHSTSTKNKPMIIHSGYRFCKHIVAGSKIHWRCSTHMNNGCKARIHTLGNNTILKCYNIHNH